MQRKKKKTTACMLILLMIISLIPTSIFATEEETMSDEFMTILNEDGKFVMNSARPETEDDALAYFCENEVMWEEYAEFSFSEFSDDYSSCIISYNYNTELGDYEEKHRVDIVYDYDEKVKATVDELVKKLPEWERDEETGDIMPYYFPVTDMELVNYWIHCDPEAFNVNNLIDYSGEFKKLIGYKNFKIDCRAGSDGEFVTEAMGFAPFMNNDILYSVQDMAVRAEHVIYVPDETGDTMEELMATAQKRLDEYLGEGKAEILEGGQGILDYLTCADKNDIALCEEDLIIYKKDLEELNNSIAEAEENMAKYQALCEECNINLSMIMQKREECSNNIAICQDNIMITQSYRDEYTTYIGENTQMIEIYNNDIQEQYAYIEEYTACMESATDEYEKEQYEQWIQDCYDTIAVCQSDADACQAVIDEYEPLVEEYQSQLDAYNTELAQYEAEYAELEEEYQSCESLWVEYSSQVDYYYNEYNNYMNNRGFMEMNVMSCESRLQTLQGYLQWTEDAYNNEDGDLHFLTEAAGDYHFVLAVPEMQFEFVIIKDSDKMIVPEYKSSDAATDVTVESDDTSVPLDTLINVEKLESGEKYDELINLLDVKENLTFDIKLFSNSLKDYITKLANGKFEVKIPIDAEFEGKNLVVYYVDENKEIHEYEVNVVDGYAVFATDHFSIYTLATIPEIQVEEGKADVPEEIVEDAITNAGDSDTVTLPLDTVEEDVVSVELPVEAIQAVAEADKSLTMETKEAVITLDTKALETIAQEAGEEASIILVVEEIKENTLSDEQKEAVKDKEVEMVISAELICNGKTISDFGGGKVEVKIPFTPAEGTEGSDYTIIYIADDGKTEDIKTHYKDGYLVAELEHFSEYVIVRNTVAEEPEKPVEPEEPVVTGDNNMWLWIGLLGAAVFAAGGAGMISHKKKTV